MMQHGMLADAPLSAVTVALFVCLMLAAIAGMAIKQRLKASADDDASEGYLLSAVLALLGLLIAFTFSLALNRYDTRREMVIAEANAISTTWLRATLATDDAGSKLREALRSYAHVRAKLPTNGDSNRVEGASMAGQERIWAAVQSATPAMAPPIAATLITATTEMFDNAAKRRAEREARIPNAVLDMLVLYAFLSAGIVGYVIGRNGRRHAAVAGLLFLLLSLSLALILDLDRPWSGNITVDQSPMTQVIASMR